MLSAVVRQGEYRLVPGDADNRSITQHILAIVCETNANVVDRKKRTFINSLIQPKVARLQKFAVASLDMHRLGGTGGGSRQCNGFKELYFRHGVNLLLFLGVTESTGVSSIPPFSGSPLNEEFDESCSVVATFSSCKDD